MSLEMLIEKILDVPEAKDSSKTLGVAVKLGAVAYIETAGKKLINIIATTRIADHHLLTILTRHLRHVLCL